MKILIATDGSEYSRAAIEECCRLAAKPENTRIKVISVYEYVYPLAGEPFAVSADFIQQIEDEAKAQAEKSVADAAAFLQNNCPDIKVSTEVIKGIAERDIIEKANEWHPDLIVVGSHGRGFWGRLTLGSVSDAVIHHAPCSVLVVRLLKDKSD